MTRAAFTVVLLLASAAMTMHAQVRGRQGTTREAPPPTHGFRGTLSGPRVQPAPRSVPSIAHPRFARPLPAFAMWWYWGGVTLPATLTSPPRSLEGAEAGGVQLDVLPWSAQVYVDGAHAGRVEDFRGYYRHLSMPAGPHVISILAAGYEPLIVEVMVVPGQTLTYRATLPTR